MMQSYNGVNYGGNCCVLFLCTIFCRRLIWVRVSASALLECVLIRNTSYRLSVERVMRLVRERENRNYEMKGNRLRRESMKI